MHGPGWRRVFASVTTACAGAATVVTFGAAPASATTLSQNWYAQAPYVMPLDNNPPNLPDVMSATGEKAFMLAFILANGNSCSAAWDGTAPVSSDTTVGNVIDVAGGGTTNGIPVQLYDCNGSGAQNWVQRSDGRLSNPQSGRCLDDPGGATANGTRLQISDCNGTAQNFVIQ